MNEQVPLHEQQQGDNEFFEYIQNDQNGLQPGEVSGNKEFINSPISNSPYSLRATSTKKEEQRVEDDDEEKRYQDNEISIQQATENQFPDQHYEKGVQLLQQLQAKQNDSRIADFLNQTEQIRINQAQLKQSQQPVQNLNVQQSFGVLQQTKPEPEDQANQSYLMYQKMMEGNRTNRYQQEQNQKQSLNQGRQQQSSQNRISQVDPMAQQYEYQMQQQQLWQQQMMKQIAMQKMQQQQQQYQQSQISAQPINQTPPQPPQQPQNPQQYMQMMKQLEQYGNVTQSQHFDVFQQQLKKLDPSQIMKNAQEGQGGEEQTKGTELFTMYMQIIGFYDKNLNNLKNIILQKDADIQSKEDKIKELSQLVNQMKSSFGIISQKYESENQELMRRYLQTIEEYGVRKLDEEQKLNGQKEQIMMEYVQLKQQHVELNNQKMNLEIMVKDLDIKHQSDMIRMNDQKMKIEYMQNEINEINQSKQLLEQSNFQILQQMEQLKMQLMEQQRQNQQWQMQVKQLSNQLQQQAQQLSDQKKQHQYLQQQQQQQYFIEQNEQQQKIISYPTQLEFQILYFIFRIQTQYSQQQQFPLQQQQQQFPTQAQQQLYQNQIPQNLQVQYQQNLANEVNKSQIQTQAQKQQPPHNNVNQTGIMAFPSDQKYYNQLDEMNALTKDLQELNFKKQQLESELNKRVTTSKTALERKKRDQQEREVEELTEQISKIKLKLREFKQ